MCYAVWSEGKTRQGMPSVRRHTPSPEGRGAAVRGGLRRQGRFRQGVGPLKKIIDEKERKTNGR